MRPHRRATLQVEWRRHLRRDQRQADVRPEHRRDFMRGLKKRAAGFEVFRYGGIVPVCEVGDKLEQCESQDIEMGFRVGSSRFSGLTKLSQFAQVSGAQLFASSVFCPAFFAKSVISCAALSRNSWGQ